MGINMDYSNPIATIQAVQDTFRDAIQKHCSNYIIKLRWINKLSLEEAIRQYLKTIKDNHIYDGWLLLAKRSKETCLEENGKILDKWVLESLIYFDLDKEILQIFEI